MIEKRQWTVCFFKTCKCNNTVESNGLCHYPSGIAARLVCELKWSTRSALARRALLLCNVLLPKSHHGASTWEYFYFYSWQRQSFIWSDFCGGGSWFLFAEMWTRMQTSPGGKSKTGTYPHHHIMTECAGTPVFWRLKRTVCICRFYKEGIRCKYSKCNIKIICSVYGYRKRFPTWRSYRPDELGKYYICSMLCLIDALSESVSESYRDGNNLKREYSLFQLFISIKRDVYDDGMFVLKHYISCCLSTVLL